MIPGRMISVCIGVRNQSKLIGHTLDSIYAQELDGYELEVIVTDDGSDDGTDKVLDRYPNMIRFRLENVTYRNGVFAKNTSLRNARGDLIIQQSSDVIHTSKNVMRSLVEALPNHGATFATVYNYRSDTKEVEAFQYTGPINHRPFFFLGACYREDVCRIGGYDPLLGNVIYYDDTWHADCLLNACRVKPLFLDVVGWHQHHDRRIYDTKPAKNIYYQLLREAIRGQRPYTSSAGLWKYEPGKSVAEVEGSLA